MKGVSSYSLSPVIANGLLVGGLVSMSPLCQMTIRSAADEALTLGDFKPHLGKVQLIALRATRELVLGATEYILLGF